MPAGPLAHRPAARGGAPHEFPMATIIAAEGLILERILDSNWTASDDGLNRQAYARFDAAQGRPRGDAVICRRFALMEDGSRSPARRN